ncbi:hypothetical protein HY792_05010 [Candidatus Desantisbacteria bacterium]|nr:hypothetical protein [Candidatus Desantisbacteria bacterium]
MLINIPEIFKKVKVDFFKNTTIFVTTQVHGSKVHGSRLKSDKACPCECRELNDLKILRLGNSWISRNMKNVR